MLLTTKIEKNKIKEFWKLVWATCIWYTKVAGLAKVRMDQPHSQPYQSKAAVTVEQCS